VEGGGTLKKENPSNIEQNIMLMTVVHHSDVSSDVYN